MIKVLIVDDCAVVRKILSRELGACDDLEIVGTAVDPYEARDKILELKPDVVTLDIEMPRLDGLSFLRKLMKYHPLPVVVVSSFTQRSSKLAFEAYSIGAVEVVGKPNSNERLPELMRPLIRAVRAASRAGHTIDRLGESDESPEVREVKASGPSRADSIIALGASTGGTKALDRVLSMMPADSPGVVIVQHMPEFFTARFSESLDRTSRLTVTEAKDMDVVKPGHALVAPGSKHLVLEKFEKGYRVRLKGGPEVHFQKPSVDVLFESVARAAGANAVGALMTGMGSDGAKGLLAMRNAGAHTITQDEASCVVYGMPKAAVDIGAACEIMSIEKIAAALIKATSRQLSGA